MVHNASTMPTKKSLPQTHSFAEQADEVELAFYHALRAGDIEQLMACWSEEDEIACIHPGGPRLLGAVTIRASFESMFSHDGAVLASIQHVRKIQTPTSSVHHVLEKIELLSPEGPVHAFILATNIYHKTEQGWKMVLHHASPGMSDQQQEISNPALTLH
jgi:ketosteroid isomerase-like protein